ncbi:MAG TPA: 50S ribosomal protein L25 [Deltaproteobacteria bacterium]|nr:50S ribosomal protein L25 [Deltaproteobacteria bacterium]
MGAKAALSLEVSERTLHKKKVRQLRREGLIPGVIHGKDFVSTPVQVNAKAFEQIYKKVHGTSIVDLSVEGKKVPVLFHSLHRDKMNRNILHIEFLKVDLARDVTVEVPIVLTGNSPLEKDGTGRVSQEEMSIHLKCSPAHIPSEIVVDISVMQEKNDSILASDLHLPEGVSLGHGVSEDKVIAMVVSTRYLEVEAEEAEVEAPEESGEAEPTPE